MKSTRSLIICAAACLCLSTTGCGKGAFSDACIQANAVVASVGAYFDEARLAIERAKDLAERLPPELQPDAIKAIAAAEHALFIVSKSAATASAQCQAPDVPSLFKDFAVLWDAVKSLLDVFGGPGAGGLVDPQAYLIGKKG